jgi:predicted regulator of Ras-like GTPase activity (Roadblock/LC7/MglB family)
MCWLNFMAPPIFSDSERLDPSAQPHSNPETGHYAEQLLGVAVFDLSGLPKTYFVSTGSSDISWVQIVFQVLGLQSLLLGSFKLDNFQHMVIRGQNNCVLLVKQRDRYMALLLQSQPHLSPALIEWAQKFNPAFLKSDPRFSPI